MLKKILPVLILLAVLAAVMVVYTQTAHFRNLAVTVICRQAGRHLDAELTIGQLQGNFFSHLTFKDVTLSRKGKNIFNVAALHLSYDLKPLLWKRVIVNDISLTRPQLHLREEEDIWNIQKIIPAREEDTEDIDSVEAGSGDWEFIIENFTIIDGQTNICRVSGTLNDRSDYREYVDPIPSAVEDININLSAAYGSRHSFVDLKDLTFKSFWADKTGKRSHEIDVKKIAFFAQYHRDQGSGSRRIEQLQLKDLRLETDNTSLQAGLDMHSPAEIWKPFAEIINDIDVNVTSSSQSLTQCNKLIPELDVQDYPNAASLDLNLDLRLVNFKDMTYFFSAVNEEKSLGLSLTAAGDAEELAAEMRVSSPAGDKEILSTGLSLSAYPDPAYHLQMQLDRLAPFEFMEKEDYSLEMTGIITAKGNTFDYHQGRINVDIDLRDIELDLPIVPRQSIGTIERGQSTTHHSPLTTHNSKLTTHSVSEITIDTLKAGIDIDDASLKTEMNIFSKELGSYTGDIFIKNLPQMAAADDPLFAVPYSISSRFENVDASRFTEALAATRINLLFSAAHQMNLNVTSSSLSLTQCNKLIPELDDESHKEGQYPAQPGGVEPIDHADGQLRFSLSGLPSLIMPDSQLTTHNSPLTPYPSSFPGSTPFQSSRCSTPFQSSRCSASGRNAETQKRRNAETNLYSQMISAPAIWEIDGFEIMGSLLPLEHPAYKSQPTTHNSLLNYKVTLDTLNVQVMSNSLQAAGYINSPQNDLTYELRLSNISPFLPSSHRAGTSYHSQLPTPNSQLSTLNSLHPLSIVPMLRFGTEGKGSHRACADADDEENDIYRENRYLSGKLSGRVSGTLDSLYTSGSLSLDDSYYEGVSAAHIMGSYRLAGSIDDFYANLSLQLEDIFIDDTHIEMITTDGFIEGAFPANLSGNIAFSLIKDEDRRVEAGMDLLAEEDMFDVVLHLFLQHDDFIWETEEQQNRITFKDDSLIIKSLIISSDEQQIYIDGNINLQKDEVCSNMPQNDLHVSLKNLELAPLAALAGYEDLKDGYLSFDLALRGSTGRPEIYSNLQLSNLHIMDTKDLHLAGEFSYPNVTSSSLSLTQCNKFIPELDYDNIGSTGQGAGNSQLPTPNSPHPSIPYLSGSLALSQQDINLAELEFLVPVLITLPFPGEEKGELGNVTQERKNNVTSSSLSLTQSNKLIPELDVAETQNRIFSVLLDGDAYFSSVIDSLNLAFFEMWIDEVTNLQGILNSTVKFTAPLADLTDIISLNQGRGRPEAEHRDDRKGNNEIHRDNGIRLPEGTDFEGNINISGGRFRIPGLGTTYRDVNIDIAAQDSLQALRFDITRFDVKSGEGKINLDGWLWLTDDSSDQLSLNFEAAAFPAIDNDMLAVLVNSNIRFSGTWKSPRFSGSISIPRARIDIDKLLEDDRRTVGEQPLLLEAVTEPPSPRSQASPPFNRPDALPPFNRPDALLRDVTPKRRNAETNRSSGSVLQSSRGELSFSFTRNVWVRGSDVNVELRADVEILKHHDYFQLFGTVSTIRGYYELYGRRFQIEEGELTFVGGREINPQVSLSAGYTFRGVDMRRNRLKLLVSGTMEDLEVSFELNDQHVEEVDAISYLMFGRSFHELTEGEKVEASSQMAVLGGFLAQRLVDEMTDLVGEALRVDMLEFRSDAATSQVGLEIGRYLTDNLFVSYKRDFNLTETEEPVTEELTFEYEITPQLFLLGTRSDERKTGLDLSWRLRWR